MFIDGKWVDAHSGKSFDVTNPATGEVLGSVPAGASEDAVAAVDAAHASFSEWSNTTPYERSRLLYRAWELMNERSEELAELMTAEQGKPLKAARAEVKYAADFLIWFAEEAKRVTGEWIPSQRPDQRFLAVKVPVGVVAAITPWNYPISMLTRKMGPALAAGCTLVLKPAESTPLCAKATYQVFVDAGIPDGVINLVTAADPAPIGDVFTGDPRVAKLTFTGSTAVGRVLATKSAANLQRISVELGGHAPFIVFPDADPVHAAKGAAALKFLNAGQACISPNRLYVPNSLSAAFEETLCSRVDRLQTGNGMSEGVGVGPLVSEAAVAKVEKQVEDARKKGAGVPIGGHRLTEGSYSAGHFFAPTVLTDISDDMTIYREETFGPVAPVITYDEPDEVIELANDTNYGLAAYVYTRDIAVAMRAFEGLRFGIIGVNDVNPTSASVPFGGMGDSGLGREGGHEGINEYLETKTGGFAI
ncbi:MAG: NAD-dependent succinate-semialdehyde dehydrogenase [Actinomycetota bacterium]|nr:succinate-semialdehyde dehydrogenase (NADP(+)) [Acidimicrobiaceae bacterium]MCH2625178.1 NAD-dependent succinate-semialdehyde dehydrogenase [Acidimicrobiales bacterium]MEC7874768.1 NAD-dependent succinate-semialdehyde dehydrogenase [Actinomycetota bacterium]MCS5682715.1 NAD-dependent succinate-semialdehyde dehydrogenase [Acidimicrobiales bacterium]MEC8828689.1 NAD-dependent succinate-semialdehyde dehydrogenase [Actinomycetota bacterium]